MSLKRIIWVVIAMLAISALLSAQDARCPVFVETAIQTVAEACADLGRNQACYGNTQVNALNFDDEPLSSFEVIGDTVEIIEMASLTTAPLDVETGVWGIAMLAVQADLPDTLPGQNVTFVLFGDTELTSDVLSTGNEVAISDYYAAPMQAFQVQAGIGALACEEAPANGLLIQAPTDTTVHFRINGVEIEVGSTAYFEFDEATFDVHTLAGSISVASNGTSQQVEPGFWTRVSAETLPSEPTTFGFATVRDLPLELLPNPVGYPFVVDSNSDWIDTGLMVQAGDRLRFQASGTVNFWPNCESEKATFDLEELNCISLILGPDGGEARFMNNSILPADMSIFPVPSIPPLSVMGQINGVPFAIGKSGEYTASHNGILQLRVNDFDTNNMGAFTVSVQILP